MKETFDLPMDSLRYVIFCDGILLKLFYGYSSPLKINTILKTLRYISTHSFWGHLQS